jgi:(E)-4-hydroxy-3-methylbut-2-enyl-diphosphate synthase
MIKRRKTKKVRIGGIYIGGGEPVAVQSMTNTNTADIKATVAQIKALEEAGCDIVRVAVPDNEAAEALKKIKESANIPVVADIHFDYRLALESIKNGADKIRINPGNIGGRDRVKKVVSAAAERGLPIRVGVNSGSLEKELLAKYGGPSAEALCESALRNVQILEDLNFDNIVISAKASGVPVAIETYRMLSERTEYPLHLGVTEAGTAFSGAIKSSVGIGCLLAEGIGDTIRVSLTGDPVREVETGKEILKSLGLMAGPRLISCPTCGRCGINLVDIAEQVEKALANIKKDIKVAVMGCAVNGPGEAREADIGIAGGQGEALLFKKGKAIGKVPVDLIADRLLEEIDKI